jgi:hypothetical protein
MIYLYILLYITVTGYILEATSYGDTFTERFKRIRILDGVLWVILTIFFISTAVENYYG